MINRKVKIIFGLSVFVFLSFFGVAKAAVELNKIVAIVNGDVITQIELDKKAAEVERYLRAVKAPVPAWSKLRKKALDDLVDTSLQLQLAKRNGVNVSDKEVDEMIENIAKGNNLSVAQMKEELPRREGISFAEFRNKLSEQAKINKVQQQFLGRGITIDEKEVAKTLRNPPKVGEVPSEYHVFDLLLKAPEDASQEKLKKLEGVAKKVALRLKGKGDINQLVEAIEKDFKDHEMVSNDLDWRKIDGFPDLFVKHVSKMKVGQVVGPIEAPNGLHLLKMLEIKKGKVLRAKITKEQAQEVVYRRELEKKLKPWMEELRKNAYIKYY